MVERTETAKWDSSLAYLQSFVRERSTFSLE